MAVSFDATVGGASANSYASVADYNQYRENTGFATRDTADAQVDLIRATTWLEAQYLDKWKTMTKTASTQSLHWPQTGATDAYGASIDTDEIPDQVKRAVYEYAIRVVASSQTALDPQLATNVKRQQLEGLGEQEFWGRKHAGSLPDDFAFIDELLYGLINAKSGGLTFYDLRGM